MAEPNPYAPGDIPRFLAGRDNELARIEVVLDRVADGGPAGAPLAFVAPRGLGKTSLLRSAEDLALPKGYAVAWLPCVKGQPVLADLVSAVERGLDQVDITPGTALPRWESLRLEVGGHGLRASSEWVRRKEDETSPGRVLATQDLLRSASRTVRGRGGAGLLLCLDELHAPALGETGVLLNALQALAHERDLNPLVVLGAGLPSTPGHLTSAATFAERWEYAELPALDAGASARALVEPAADAEVRWSAAGLGLAESYANGYPYLLQLVGAAAWDVAQPSRGEEIRAPHTEEGWQVAQARLRTLFQGRWDAATAGEQAFLTAMAAAGVPSVPRATVAAALGVPTSSISQTRASLINKGIIARAGHGQLEFTLPGFAEHVREVTGEGG
ncbi:ATP-binding protein [Ornithinimicrobium avium]|uniref:ATP-binding protein n=1 Tax=Ornithinimicrobium avium TaxID=2283195 RepID=A0A345NQB7_9MICO|nr:ATP-binding protein [Ornithinimicrobium avium]AXH97225.1 ATP-binding protein [Ornithinimicrobium avium]